jgi:hypothetical protein
MATPLRILGWLAGSLLALLAVNLLLVLFVAGTDVLLGQPPQVAAPVFGVIVAAAALVAIRRFGSSVAGDSLRRAGYKHLAPLELESWSSRWVKGNALAGDSEASCSVGDGPAEVPGGRAAEGAARAERTIGGIGQSQVTEREAERLREERRLKSEPPGYLSMTIIKRAPVRSQAADRNQPGGFMQ